jgi:tRNA G18 (ribose-2'-O)-methylase SpoU
MITLHNVTGLERPELQPYQTLRRPLDHQREGIFVAEGEKVVKRLLDSDLTILSILLTPEWLAVCRGKIEARKEPIELFVAKKKLVEGIVGFNLHQGIMAVARIPEPITLERLLADSPHPYFLVAVDGLTNSENLGVLVRNCVGFGVQALLVGETSSSPYLRRAVRNSMGSVFTLPVIPVTDLAGVLRTLHTKHRVQSFAAHPHAKESTLQRAVFTSDCCLVFGSEGEGISQRVLEACGERIAIPMLNGVDSLNVASASAVVFYEVVRQRTGK